MRIFITAIVLGWAGVAQAQKPPLIRQIGALEHVSADSMSFRSISTALAMPGGRVMVNDMTGRRAVILDSTLSRSTVVADTTNATANAYGTSASTLIHYRGDTALLVVPSTLSMFVLGPTGATMRVMAMPRPNDAQPLAGGFNEPGVDARGRLVYFGGGPLPHVTMLARGMQLLQDGKPTAAVRSIQQFGDPTFNVGKLEADSGFVVRVDLETRTLDTVTSVRLPKFKREIKVDGEGKLVSFETTPDPLPVIDQWAVLRDGTIAIVRGRDYHIDWIDASGTRTSSPKLPFDWQRVDDARKTALIDSAVGAVQKTYDDIAASRIGGAGRATVGSGGGTGGRGGGGGGNGRGAELAPTFAARPSLDDLTDYFPPFEERAVTADMDNNLWVQTTQLVDGRPVYDVINRRGEVIDRVQLPRYRTIAGFGPGVIYMAVIVDASGKVRLERARVK